MSQGFYRHRRHTLTNHFVFQTAFALLPFQTVATLVFATYLTGHIIRTDLLTQVTKTDTEMFTILAFSPIVISDASEFLFSVCFALFISFA